VSVSLYGPVVRYVYIAESNRSPYVMYLLCFGVRRRLFWRRRFFEGNPHKSWQTFSGERMPGLDVLLRSSTVKPFEDGARTSPVTSISTGNRVYCSFQACVGSRRGESVEWWGALIKILVLQYIIPCPGIVAFVALAWHWDGFPVELASHGLWSLSSENGH